MLAQQIAHPAHDGVNHQNLICWMKTTALGLRLSFSITNPLGDLFSVTVVSIEQTFDSKDMNWDARAWTKNHAAAATVAPRQSTS